MVEAQGAFGWYGGRRSGDRDWRTSLAAATAAALDAEIDWIESQAINVYRGAGGDSLGHSIPIGH